MNQNNAGGFLNTIPPVTRNIIIINVLFAIAQFLLGKNGIQLYHYLGLYFYKSELFMPHQFFTCMFMHSSVSITHILFNMFALYMFGKTLEMVWGAKKFLVFYIVCGLGASLAQELAWMFDFREIIYNPAITQISTEMGILSRQEFYNAIPPAVGASGCVFGILVGFGMLFPNAKLMIIPIPVPIKAKWVVMGYGVMELILGAAQFKGDNIAHFAHLGGLVTGFIITYFWKKKGRLNGRLDW